MNTQSSTETENNKNYPLIEREKIENTPFWIVGNKEMGYKITWGKYTFNDEPLEYIDEAKTWYDEHHWEIIMHIVAVGIQSTKEKETL